MSEMQILNPHHPMGRYGNFECLGVREIRTYEKGGKGVVGKRSNLYMFRVKSGGGG